MGGAWSGSDTFFAEKVRAESWRNGYHRVTRAYNEKPAHLIDRSIMELFTSSAKMIELDFKCNDSELVHPYQMQVWKGFEAKGFGVGSASPGHMVVRPETEM